MRTSRRLRALLPLLVLTAGAATASPARAEGPLGGELLAGSGIVTDDPADAPPPVSAMSYVVADVDTGAVLAAKDAHGRYAPASTLKTLTAVTLIPRLPPDNQVTPTREDVDVDGSKVGLVTQMSYSVRQLFTAMLVVSGNDAAGALADAAGGTQVATGLMNDEAARLQARDTHAINASGLDADGQVSSAYDLALIARAGLAMPDFRTYVATRRSSVPAPGGATIDISTHNKLLGTYDGALGVKNGYTDAARASFVGAAARDGHTLVVTLMRADPAVWKDAAALLDWGFAATARSARPVGTLVDPVAARPVAVDAAPRGALAAPVAVSHRAPSGTSPLVPATSLTGLLAVLVGLRRRAVVRARARRRAAARRTAQRPSTATQSTSAAHPTTEHQAPVRHPTTVQGRPATRTRTARQSLPQRHDDRHRTADDDRVIRLPDPSDATQPARTAARG